jgi:excinuclease ABC subunit C
VARSNLRQRSNYFQDLRNLPQAPRNGGVGRDGRVDPVRNEVEALMLEHSLIKQHKPRFNIRLRDDKSYPFLAITLDEEWLRAMVMRGRAQGRATSACTPRLRDPRHARPVAPLVLIRTCSPGKYHQHERLGRPCLLFHIEKCSGPCVGEIRGALRRLVAELIEPTATPTIVHRLETQMRSAASELEFNGRRACVTGCCCAAPSRSSRWWPTATKTSTIGVADDDLSCGVLRAQGTSGRAQGFIIDRSRT